MIISFMAICYVLGMGIEVGLLFVRWKVFLCIPVIGFSIAFFFTREPSWLWIALIDLLIAALGICVAFIADAIRAKKKPSAEDKSKIKDL